MSQDDNRPVIKFKIQVKKNHSKPSLYVEIPDEIAEAIKLRDDDEVEMYLSNAEDEDGDNKIVINCKKNIFRRLLF